MRNAEQLTQTGSVREPTHGDLCVSHVMASLYIPLVSTEHAKCPLS